MEEESRGGEGGSHGTCEVLLCPGHSEGRGGPPFPPQPEARQPTGLPEARRGQIPAAAASCAPPPPEQQQKETGHDEQQGDETQLFYLSISMVSLSLTSDKVVD